MNCEIDFPHHDKTFDKNIILGVRYSVGDDKIYRFPPKKVKKIKSQIKKINTFNIEFTVNMSSVFKMTQSMLSTLSVQPAWEKASNSDISFEVQEKNMSIYVIIINNNDDNDDDGKCNYLHST